MSDLITVRDAEIWHDQRPSHPTHDNPRREIEAEWKKYQDMVDAWEDDAGGYDSAAYIAMRKQCEYCISLEQAYIHDKMADGKEDIMDSAMEAHHV